MTMLFPWNVLCPHVLLMMDSTYPVLASLGGYFRSIFHDDQHRSEQYRRSKQNSILLHDAGLVGPRSIQHVVEVLCDSPFATELALSHNRLGDEGVRALCDALSSLSSEGRLKPGVCNLNLSSNALTDMALEYVLTSLLLPKSHSRYPTLTKLYLTANLISLGSPGDRSLPHIPFLLSSVLARPTNNLRTLSLNNNPAIGDAGLAALIQNLDLVHLEELHICVCGLGPQSAEGLAAWLTKRSTRSLLNLYLNGNSLGKRGVERIQWVVRAGLNTSLAHLELYANESPADYEDFGDLQNGDTTQVHTSTAPIDIDMALRRNRELRDASQRAALALLARARILLNGVTGPSSSSMFGMSYARLPNELRLAILRWIPLSSVADLVAGLPLPPTPSVVDPTTGKTVSREPSIAFPLSETQFLDVLAYAMDRRTLRFEQYMEAGLCRDDAGRRAGLLVGDSGKKPWSAGWERREAEDFDGKVWTAAFWEWTGTNRFVQDD